MKKGNKTRLLFWGIVWIIVLALAGGGYYSYLSGHGVKGEVRHNLKPIVEKFNNLKGFDILSNPLFYIYNNKSILLRQLFLL